MEQLFGLTQDDPLARMLIVQLHVADLTAEIYEKRSQEERRFLEETRSLAGELHGLITSVGQARIKLERKLSGSAAVQTGGNPVAIDAYRKVSPLWSYLAGAFRWRNGVVDTDERIGAARLDLAYVTGVAAIIFMCGFYIGKHI